MKEEKLPMNPENYVYDVVLSFSSLDPNGWYANIEYGESYSYGDIMKNVDKVFKRYADDETKFRMEFYMYDKEGNEIELPEQIVSKYHWAYSCDTDEYVGECEILEFLEEFKQFFKDISSDEDTLKKCEISLKKSEMKKLEEKIRSLNEELEETKKELLELLKSETD